MNGVEISILVTIIVVAVVIAFVALLAFAVINIFNIQPLIKYCEANKEHQGKIFFLVFVQIIGMGYALTNSTLLERKTYQEAYDQAQIDLSQTTASKKAVAQRLELTLDAWRAASESWMNEPSGLSATALADENGEPIIVGVDDDESAVFILQAIDGHFPLVSGTISLRTLDNKDIVNDLEAITHAGENQYYAITSHRRLGDKNKFRKSRKLIGFTLTEDRLTRGYQALTPDEVHDLTELDSNKENRLGQFLRNNGVAIDGWEKEGDLPHPFALEIEGLSYQEDKLLIGLRWPLVNGNAILLRFDPAKSQFDGFQLIELGIDDEPHGISALTIKDNQLYVASNPPHKVDSKVNPGDVQYFGKSRVWQFDVTQLFAADEERMIQTGKMLQIRPKSNSKLEGLAVHAQKLFLSFEGDETHFEMLDMPQ